jgi:hypothetical protein
MNNKSIWVELKEKHGLARILVDVFMILVVMINLFFIIFDWHFQFAFFQSSLSALYPGLYQWYKTEIHPNFLLYDAYFVAIFVTELLISWVVAVKNKKYSRWWFYPFIHWYDVLGCIPVGFFRWLRMFRIVSMMLRLHQYEIIDLKKNVVYNYINNLYILFTNKVTDKVLINLVSGIQREVVKETVKPTAKTGSGYIADAIRPDQEELARVLVAKFQRSAKNNYSLHRDELKDQIFTIVREGFDKSAEIKKLEQVPVVGKQISKSIENSLSDVAFQLVDSLLRQLTSEETGKLMEQSFHTTLYSVLYHSETKASSEKDEELNRIIRNIFGRILERMKNDIGKENHPEEAF